jgi:hypothetical protein
LAVFTGYVFFMAKAVHFKVCCTVCHEVFQNDYVGKHTKSKHKDLHMSGRQAPVTIELVRLILVKVKWMLFPLNSCRRLKFQWCEKEKNSH